jgi:KaiC/GvpD/RAD55 family RecA-like ATPase
MSTPTGSRVLDDLLNGGFPENRVMLLTGGPGTGKTTFGLQYLQEGLENDENCLFISTEQTPTELRQTYEAFEFDLDHDNLTLTTIHQTREELIETGEESLAITTLGDDEEDPFPGVPVPFETQYVGRLLERYADSDRVVLDSISGIAALADSQHAFRRAVLDLVRLFADDIGATTLFTAEEENGDSHEFSESTLLQFTTHGVVQLTHEQIRGTLHRYVRVSKMRGVDHDTGKHEFEMTRRGIEISSQRPARSPALRKEPLSTGVDGLDRICGGGIFPKQPVVLQHDGRIDVDPITTSIMCEAIEDGGGVVLFAPSHMGPDQLDDWLGDRVGSVRELLENDQLFVLDWFDSWDIDHQNIFPVHRGRLRGLLIGLDFFRDPLFRQLYQRIDRRRGDQTVVSIVYSETILQDLTPETIRFQVRWVQSNIFQDDDLLVVTHNPEVMDKRLAEFFVYDAVQVFNVWRESANMNYVSVEKSPTGVIGSSRLLENVEEPPFIRVRNG